MAGSSGTARRRNLWLGTAAPAALTTFAAWIPVAGGQPVDPLVLVAWWALAALSLGSAAGLVLRTTWSVALLRFTCGIWLVLSGTLAGVTRAFGFPRAAGVAATIGWGAAAAFAVAAIALWFGLRAHRAR